MEVKVKTHKNIPFDYIFLAFTCRQKSITMWGWMCTYLWCMYMSNLLYIKCSGMVLSWIVNFVKEDSLSILILCFFSTLLYSPLSTDICNSWRKIVCEKIQCMYKYVILLWLLSINSWKWEVLYKVEIQVIRKTKKPKLFRILMTLRCLLYAS